MRKHLREMDLIRAVSALSIIMIHVSGSYAFASRGGYIANQAARFAVPVFILISGLLLEQSGYEFKGIAKYFGFIGKRLKKIFIPYIIWSVIYILYEMRNDLSPVWNDSGSFLTETGRKLLYGTAHMHLYFIIIIFQLYLLFPLLKYLMKKWNTVIMEICFLVSLVFQTGVWLQSMGIGRMPGFFLPNYMFFPTWIFYFAFGMYISRNLEKSRQWINKHTAMLGFAWLVSLALLLVESRCTDTLDLSIKPTVMLYSIITFFFMYSITLRLPDGNHPLITILQWVSAQSFLIYLGHPLILKILTLHTGISANTGIWAYIPGMLLYYSAGIICTCLLTYIASLTPMASLLGGISAKRKTNLSSAPLQQVK